MKAVMYSKYGSPDVLQIREIEKPSPDANDVLVKVHASSVTMADTMMRDGKPFYGRLFLGLTGPKRLITGTGFAGVVEAVGGQVTRFKPGDAVFGESIFGSGSNAEYLCAPEDGIITMLPTTI
ncbi:MAG: NAD(P)-dependent alcohol dehydrogenase, partial [Chloroflexi bacterium]